MLGNNISDNRYPLPELTTLTVTKSPSDFTNFEHLFVGQLLEEFGRIKRAKGQEAWTLKRKGN